MKIALLTLLLFSLVFSKYEKGKIDMHGGKDEAELSKKEREKRAFRNTSMGLSLYLDTNSTKRKNAPKK